MTRIHAAPAGAASQADEINMLLEKLSAEWGSVVISCDQEGCSVSDPGGEESFDGKTLVEALRTAEQEVCL